MACCCCRGTTACRKNGECTERPACECEADGGVPCGAGSTCDECGCCCFEGGPQGFLATRAQCEEEGGIWTPGLTCSPSACAPSNCNDLFLACGETPTEIIAEIDVSFPSFFSGMGGCTLNEQKGLSLSVALTPGAFNSGDCGGYSFDGCTGDQEFPYVFVEVWFRAVNSSIVAYAYLSAFRPGPPCQSSFPSRVCDNPESTYNYNALFTGAGTVGGGGCLSVSISGSVQIPTSPGAFALGNGTGSISLSVA